MTDRTKFIKWFVRPYNRLKRVPRGDGAFVILSVGIALCERYFRIKTNLITSKNLTDKFHKAAAKSVGCDQDAFEIFWNVYRHGMQHRAQPQIWIDWWNKKRTKKVKTRFKWEISSDFTGVPKVVTKKGKKVVQIYPQEFTRFISGKFLNDAPALRASIRHQFGEIYS